MKRFFANAVAVEEMPELESFVVVFSERPDDGSQRLELQISLEDDPSQGELNNYCLVTETQATYYGGITACTLQENKLTILLTQDASEELGVETGFDIDFQVADRAALLNLSNGLQRILSRAISPVRASFLSPT